MRRFILIAFPTALLLIGCRTTVPLYTVDFPFSNQRTASVQEVDVRLCDAELFNPMPLSLSGLWSARAEILQGEIPLHPERRSFLVRIRQHPVVDSLLSKGEVKVTVMFDSEGNILGIKEFSEALEGRRKSINSQVNYSQ